MVPAMGPRINAFAICPHLRRPLFPVLFADVSVPLAEKGYVSAGRAGANDFVSAARLRSDRL